MVAAAVTTRTVARAGQGNPPRCLGGYVEAIPQFSSPARIGNDSTGTSPGVLGTSTNCANSALSRTYKHIDNDSAKHKPSRVHHDRDNDSSLFDRTAGLHRAPEFHQDSHGCAEGCLHQ